MSFIEISAMKEDKNSQDHLIFLGTINSSNSFNLLNPSNPLIFFTPSLHHSLIQHSTFNIQLFQPIQPTYSMVSFSIRHTTLGCNHKKDAGNKVVIFSVNNLFTIFLFSLPVISIKIFFDCRISAIPNVSP